MSASNFKAGDRVKVSTLVPYIGAMTGRIERLRRDGDCWVRFDGVLPKHLQSKTSLVRMNTGNLEHL
jgi:hypothetical protein